MTRLITRLLLAILLVPVSAAVFLVCFAPLLGNKGPPPMWQMLAVWGVVDTFIGVYWLLLWRDVVKWTPRRQMLTVAVTAVALLVGAVAVSFIYEISGIGFPAALVGGGFVPVVWVLLTVLVWRETAAERIARLRAMGAGVITCPTCGYNLSGLSEARCPECGGRFTLDELVVAHEAGDRTSLGA